MKKVCAIAFAVCFAIFSCSAFGVELFIPIDVVYHGSPKSDIRVLEPKSEHVRDQEEGSVVFATSSIKLASCYLFRWDDSWVHQFVSENTAGDFDVYMIIGDKKRFEERDSGGAVYLLPATNFMFDKTKGMGVYEWTSNKSAAPFGKLVFSSSLDAMKNFGVKIFFLKEKEFKEYIKLSQQEQGKFLKKIKRY